MSVLITIDHRTLDAVSGALRASGDATRSLQDIVGPLVVGECALTGGEARQLWFTIRILTDPTGTPLDAAEGSAESYFGCLREHQPALDLLQSLEDQEARPELDLITPQMERDLEPVGDA